MAYGKMVLVPGTNLPGLATSKGDSTTFARFTVKCLPNCVIENKGAVQRQPLPR